jgi:hypothetical protein
MFAELNPQSRISPNLSTIEDNNMSTAVTPVPDGAKPLSQFERMANIFVAPSKTFVDLKRDSSWWMPFLVLTICSWIFVGSVDKKIGFDQVVETALANMSDSQKARMEQAPPEQQQQQIKMMKAGYQYGSYAFPLVLLIIFALFAAVYMGAFNFGLGTEISYKHAFAVVVYASLPTIVRTLLAVISIFALASPDSFNFENPVATNPGILVSVTQHPALYKLLASLDAVTIWSLIVTGIGFSTISKVKRGTAIGVILGVYAVVVLVQVGFKAI